MWIVLWSLVLGGVPISIGDKTPPLLFFDVVLVIVLVWKFWFSRVPLPDFSDRKVIYLASAYLLACVISTAINPWDMPKSLMSIKVFICGILVYSVARSWKPRLWHFSGFGLLVSGVLAFKLIEYLQDAARNILTLKYSIETPLGGSNYVAALLMMVLPLSVAGFVVTKGSWRWGHLAAVVAEIVGLAITASRGILLSVILCAIVALPLMVKAGVRVKHLALVGILGTVFLVSLPSELFALNVTLVQQRIENPDLDRLDIWRLCTRESIENPFFGVGPGQSVDYVARLHIPSDARLNAHDLVLNATMDAGIVGTIPFLWMLWVIFRRAWSVARARMSPIAIAVWLAIFMALLSDIVEGSFVGQQFQVLFWMIAAMLPITTFRHDSSGAPPLSPTRHVSRMM